MDTVIACILWRRLDAPGHDACALLRAESGWRLEGSAVFLQGGEPAMLAYLVDCDPGWRSTGGRVTGRIGGRAVDRIFAPRGGGWTSNGAAAPDTEDCPDLDFSFTPATNFFALRRLSLTEGEAADAPAAWFDLESGRLTRLNQRYRRRGADYWYEAPETGYAALLETAPDGFVRRYPGLWEAEG